LAWIRAKHGRFLVVFERKGWI